MSPIRAIYEKILENIILIRLLFLNRDLVLVDFDFTLAIHKATFNYSWDLRDSLVNQTLLNEIKSFDFFVFTARGLCSRKEVYEWLSFNEVHVKGFLPVGSTKGKLNVVRKVLRFSNRNIIWYDDLCEVSFDLSKRINFDMNINSPRLEFHRT